MANELILGAPDSVSRQVHANTMNKPKVSYDIKLWHVVLHVSSGASYYKPLTFLCQRHSRQHALWKPPKHAKAIEDNHHSDSNQEDISQELSTLRRNRKPSNKSRSNLDWVREACQEERPNQKSSPHATCYRCGEPGHRSCDKARGKTCRWCGKKNHFAKACRSTLAATNELNKLDRGGPQLVDLCNTITVQTATGRFTHSILLMVKPTKQECLSSSTISQ